MHSYRTVPFGTYRTFGVNHWTARGLVVRGDFADVSLEVKEAAKVDGCNWWENRPLCRLTLARGPRLAFIRP